MNARRPRKRRAVNPAFALALMLAAWVPYFPAQAQSLLAVYQKIRMQKTQFSPHARHGIYLEEAASGARQAAAVLNLEQRRQLAAGFLQADDLAAGSAHRNLTSFW